MNVTEVVIVGAGPIGLELAAALKTAGVDYTQFDAGQIGQTVVRYPKSTRFFSSPQRIAIAGLPLHTHDQSKASREEYLAYLRQVVEHFQLEVHTYERVTVIEPNPKGGFLIRTDRLGVLHQHEAKYVVLAVGDMAWPRLLHIPGEDLGHVSHYFDEPHLYFGKRLLIVGGKNSAVEAAIRCHRAGAKVAISYRREHFDPDRVKYWLLPEIQGLIRSGQVRFFPQTVPLKISPSHVLLGPSSGVIADPVNVPADFVLLLTGYQMDTTLFDRVGVRMVGENRAPAHNPQTMETNVPGVFVVGTAAAGTQETFRLFIENCHAHIPKIVAAITGQAVEASAGSPGAAPAPGGPGILPGALPGGTDPES